VESIGGKDGKGGKKIKICFVLQIPFIKKARELCADRPLKLFASPWSPPYWMKDNGKFNESGALKGAIGGQYYDAFAEYIVK